MDGRQESVAEDIDPPQRDPAAPQHHESGQVPVLTAQAVADPGAQGGKPGEGRPAVKIEVGLSVGHELGGHGADHRQLVGNAADVGKEIADGDSAASVALELPRAGEDVAVQVEHGPFSLERHGLARLLVEAGLGIEGIDLGQASRQVTKDDVLDPGLVMPPPGGQGIIRSGGSQTRVGGIGHEGRQGQHPESGGGPPQHLAPGESGLDTVVPGIVSVATSKSSLQFPRGGYASTPSISLMIGIAFSAVSTNFATKYSITSAAGYLLTLVM